jgi:NAD(P)-dependent dehydrogenase (short-subunit alcohol dehydrogenase family)
MNDDLEEVPNGYVATLFDLRGYQAVVTGAGSGLGAAMAKGLAQAGAEIHLLDVNTEGMALTESRIHEGGGTASSHLCDVTSKASLEEVQTKIATGGDSPQILINSAGTAIRSAAEDFAESDFDKVIALNLKGTFLACQVFGQDMLSAERGSIINIASIGGFRAYPWASAYLASKGGVVQLTKALALEWGQRGVRVNAIGPTLMHSALTRRGSATSTITSDFIRARMPINRLGLPRQLVGAAIFLAGPASELVNGHTLMCDDGYLTS